MKTLTLTLTFDEARMLAAAAGPALDRRAVAAAFFPDEADRATATLGLSKLHTAIGEAAIAASATVCGHRGCTKPAGHLVGGHSDSPRLGERR
jgi:hypothetical protein